LGKILKKILGKNAVGYTQTFKHQRDCSALKNRFPEVFFGLVAFGFLVSDTSNQKSAS
jgi:hypothetical protein